MTTKIIIAFATVLIIAQAGTAQDHCKNLDVEKHHPDDPSIVLNGWDRSRFGNQLFTFAMLLELQRTTKMQVYLHSTSYQILKDFFTEDSLKVIPLFNDTFCNAKDLEMYTHFTHFNGHFTELVRNPDLHTGKILQIYQKGLHMEEHEGHELKDLIANCGQYVKNHMHFKPHIVKKVKETLEELKKKRGKMTLIAVHVRRTDHLKYMKEEFQRKPLKAHHFNDAMDYFREEYPDSYFIVASDDIKWAKKKLVSINDDVYFSDVKPSFKVDEEGIFRDKDIDKAVYDFVLLTSCQHAVVSRGSFTLWVATLTGGEYYTEHGVVIPNHMLDALEKKRRKSI